MQILPVSSPIVVGQRIATGMYGRGPGVVVGIDDGHGSAVPVLGRVGSGRRTFDIVFASGEQSRALPECILRGVQWRVFDEVADAEEVAGAIATAGVYAAKQIADKEAAAQSFAEQMEALRVCPTVAHLKPVQNRYGNEVTANIRAHLRHTFPGVKFSVRKEGRIRWTDGPTTEQVDAVLAPFKAGSFDGMQDLYEYNRTPWNELFGQEKYISTARENSDLLIGAAIALVFERYAARLQGIEAPTVSQYKRGGLYSIPVCLSGPLFWRAHDLQAVIGAVAYRLREAPGGYVLVTDEAEGAGE